MSLDLIAFDADDTLWHHERHYQFTEERFAELLAAHAPAEHLAERLLAAEKRNIGHYGYGVKGFTLSMIETAIEVTKGRVPAAVISDLLAVGRDLLAHPIEVLPGVAETLEALKRDHRLIVITKGDLFDQERKLASSGVDHWFDAVEIVSEKDAAVYGRLFRRHGSSPDTAMMVGNSLKSDILPALETGAWGVHVPAGRHWALDHAEAPQGSARFRAVEAIAEVPGVVAVVRSGVA